MDDDEFEMTEDEFDAIMERGEPAHLVTVNEHQRRDGRTVRAHQRPLR